jgi:hypothetical protein
LKASWKFHRWLKLARPLNRLANSLFVNSILKSKIFHRFIVVIIPKVITSMSRTLSLRGFRATAHLLICAVYNFEHHVKQWFMNTKGY